MLTTSYCWGEHWGSSGPRDLPEIQETAEDVTEVLPRGSVLPQEDGDFIACKRADLGVICNLAGLSTSPQQSLLTSRKGCAQAIFQGKCITQAKASSWQRQEPQLSICQEAAIREKSLLLLLWGLVALSSPLQLPCFPPLIENPHCGQMLDLKLPF